MDKKQQFSLWYFLAVFIGIMLMQQALFAPHLETLAYSDFKKLVAAGKVIEVTITDQLITGTLKNEGLENLLPKEKLEELKAQGKGDHGFSTIRVDDPSLAKDLEAAQVRFTGRVESKFLSTLLSWVVPAVIFVALWGFLMKRMGGDPHGSASRRARRNRIMARAAGGSSARKERSTKSLAVPARLRRRPGRGDMERHPVCGMLLDPKEAAGEPRSKERPTISAALPAWPNSNRPGSATQALKSRAEARKTRNPGATN